MRIPILAGMILRLMFKAHPEKYVFDGEYEGY